jgi:hypothetical protein
MAGFFPDGKWAVDALKLPAKITGGVFLAGIVLLSLSALEILPLATFGFLSAPIVTALTVVSGCLTFTAMLADAYERYRNKEKAGQLTQRRELRLAEQRRLREEHDEAVAARIDYLSADEIRLIADCLRKGEQSFTGYSNSPITSNLYARDFVSTPGGAHHMDHYPFFFTDGAWKALLARKDELIAKDDEHKRRQKAEEEAQRRRSNRY